MPLHVEELEARTLLSVAPLPTTNTNWSGYAVQTNLTSPQNGAVSAVSGTWTVPTVTGTSRGYSAAWVGIDGYSSNTVEQIGTEQDISSRGKASYYAWYEFYPNNSVTIPNFAVAPGDVISAEVSYSSGSFTLQITDTPISGAAPETFSIIKTAPGAVESSAEWIMEAPSAVNTLPLASFGTMNFTNAWATIAGTTGPIDNPAWQAAQINMVAYAGFRSQTVTTKDVTTGLTDVAPSAGNPYPPPAGTASVSSFSITYSSSTTTTQPTLTRPVPSGPSGVIATTLPTFAWSNVAAADSYEVWLTDQTTDTNVTYPNVTSTSWTPPQALNLGDNYTWWVGSVQGQTIAWSASLRFVIQPTGVGPSGPITTTLPTFSWTAVTGAASYEIWLTDQTTGTDAVYPNLTGTTWTPPEPLNLGHKYVWWVGAVVGQTTVWDSALRFSIQPTGSGPSGAITTNLPTFSWNSVTGAASYEIWLTDQTTGADAIYPNLTDITWTPPQPLNLGDKYIWWVGAVQGQTIAWDAALKFVIQPTASGPSSTITASQPTFSWNSVTGAASYEIWLTDQTTGMTVTYPNLTVSSWTPPQALNVGDKYIWWVGAVQGNSIAWDDGLTFTISAG